MNQNDYIENEKEQRRRKRIRQERIRRKRMLRRLILMGMALIVLLIVVSGFAIGNAVSNKKAEKEAAEQKKAQEKVSSKKKKEKTLEEQVDDMLKLARKEGYPKEIINILSKNPETLDFVKNYPEKKDNPVAETIGEDLKPGEIPHLLQWDERWGYAPYGTSTIAASGCGPTCMSMIIAGLTGDASVTPYALAKYSEENYYLDETNNTYWIFMNEVAGNWGINCWETMLDETQVQQELDAGHPIVCSVGPGDFTTSGHFVILTGYQDGKVTIRDPNSKVNTEKEWVYQEIKDQIKSMWIYSL